MTLQTDTSLLQGILFLVTLLCTRANHATAETRNYHDDISKELQHPATATFIAYYVSEVQHIVAQFRNG